jgi:uncharacterized membrane protein YkvA (DUF1232 family)
MPSSDPHHQSDGNHETSFWKKIKQSATAAGKAVILQALTLYYCSRDSDTPAWAKGIIISALGYFIFPLDAIPDFIPLTGYSDDFGALGLAIATVAVHIKDEHKAQAQEQLKRWFS